MQDGHPLVFLLKVAMKKKRKFNTSRSKRNKSEYNRESSFEILKHGSSQVCFKIGNLKNFAIFRGVYLYWSLFLIKAKLQVWKPATSLKRVSTQIISCEYSEFFKNSFSTDHLREHHHHQNTTTFFELWSHNKIVKLCQSHMYTSIFSYWEWYVFAEFLSDSFHYFSYLLWIFVTCCEANPICSDIDYYAIWHWMFVSTTSIWEDKLL